MLIFRMAPVSPKSAPACHESVAAPLAGRASVRISTATPDVDADLLGMAGRRLAKRARQMLVCVDDAAIFHDREPQTASRLLGRPTPRARLQPHAPHAFGRRLFDVSGDRFRAAKDDGQVDATAHICK